MHYCEVLYRLIASYCHVFLFLSTRVNMDWYSVYNTRFVFTHSQFELFKCEQCGLSGGSKNHTLTNQTDYLLHDNIQEHFSPQSIHLGGKHRHNNTFPNHKSFGIVSLIFGFCVHYSNKILFGGLRFDSDNTSWSIYENTLWNCDDMIFNRVINWNWFEAITTDDLCDNAYNKVSRWQCFYHKLNVMWKIHRKHVNCCKECTWLPLNQQNEESPIRWVQVHVVHAHV